MNARYDFKADFCAALEAHDIIPPDHLVVDGRLHRCDAAGRNGKGDAAYQLWIDDGDRWATGGYNNWRNGGDWIKWTPEKQTLTKEERAAFRAQATKAARAAREYKQRLQIEAKNKAAKMLEEAIEVDADHPYLIKKGIEAHDLNAFNDQILVPMRDSEGVLHNLQLISPESDKRFLFGGRVVGCFHILGEPRPVMGLAEGLATAASIRDAITDLPVAIAFNAGNLMAAGLALARKGHRLIICGDDDWKTTRPPNPGRVKALELLEALKTQYPQAGHTLVFPRFGDDREDDETDFNDMAARYGNKEVRKIVERAIESKAGDDQWSDPVPLPAQLLPVARFDLAFLPEMIAGWVADIAERMQCPLDLVGVPAMAALGATLGTKIGIHPKQYDDWYEVPNFWCCIIGRPGTLKSPALREVLKPMRELDAMAKQRYEEAIRIHNTNLEAFELRKRTAKDLKRNKLREQFVRSDDLPADAQEEAEQARIDNVISEPPPEEPKEHRYIVNDSSYEALGQIGATNPQGILIERDELVSLFVNLDRPDLATSRGFYLTGWNGTGTYNFDRITRGRTKVSKLCLSIVGCATPGGIGGYIRNAVTGGQGDDGMLQRFSLAVWPDQSGWTLIDRLPDINARAAARQAFQWLDEYKPADTADTDPNDPSVRTIRFSLEAQPLFVTWYRALETELRNPNTHPALLSHFGKYRKLVPTLALVNHLADGRRGPVDADALRRAIAFGAYLKTHALRLYGAATRADVEGAHAILAKIRQGALRDDFTLRDVHRNGWAGLTNQGTIGEALALLEQHHFIAATKVTTGRRTWYGYKINPHSLTQNKVRLPPTDA